MSILKLNGVSTYYGEIEAIKEIDLQVDEGEIVAVIGANGAGKTTLINTISGLIRAAKGKIIFMGQEIQDKSPDRIVELGIIHVPEGRQIFCNMTVMENLELGAYLRLKKRKNTEVKADIDYVMNLFPILRERHKQIAGTLSGGEQQMLALARALMARPKLLLMDEPSMGLSPLIVRELFDIIKKLSMEGKTILLVEQNANLALSISKRAYVMETGRIVMQGNSDEIFDREKLKRAYMGYKISDYKVEKPKIILSGNEAIARGAYEAGVKVATAYPGTPSTEILEALTKYKDVYCEWSPNEKVALEVAIGSSIAGARSLVSMKHVGLNVASDPLFTLSYTGIKGGLVIVTADDPSLYSSQNEQDNRNYAKFAKIPMLEPSDSMEAKEFVKMAFEISEQFDTPVLLRTTTRISHSKGIVTLEDREEVDSKIEPEKNIPKYVMMPAFARLRHPIVEDRIRKLSTAAETMSINRIEWGNRKIGIITSGICYNHAKEVFPDASYLKLGMVYPIPHNLIRKFASEVEKILVIEELDPFLEEQIKEMGITVVGKDILPMCGEYTPDILRKSFGLISNDIDKSIIPEPNLNIPVRHPSLCPGCSHRAIFTALRKLKVFVSGDIGCYTLAALSPIEALHSCICMGASIGMAHGIEKAMGKDAKGKVVAVIGDSTFFHSGITSLIDIAYNKGNSTIIILDNRTTAMTGGQAHPGTGKTAKNEETIRIDIEAIVRAVGIKRVSKINSYNISEAEEIIKREINIDEPSVIIVEMPCVLVENIWFEKMTVIKEKCTGCGVCLKAGCIAMEFKTDVDGKKYVSIDPDLCRGCTVCQQLCKFGAIEICVQTH